MLKKLKVCLVSMIIFFITFIVSIILISQQINPEVVDPIFYVSLSGCTISALCAGFCGMSS